MRATHMVSRNGVILLTIIMSTIQVARIQTPQKISHDLKDFTRKSFLAITLLMLHADDLQKVREAKINLKPSRVQSNCTTILARPVAVTLFVGNNQQSGSGTLKPGITHR